MLAAPFEFMLLVWRNLRRHLLRSLLTVLGVGIALFAFCMIRTIVGGWYAGVEATAKNRMVVRNAVSIIFYLPLAYREAIARTPGVAKVGYGNWFGGIYVDKKNMVAQFAVDDNYLDLCPEYILAPEAKEAWLASRKGILAGEEFAKEFGIKTGDVLQLQGTIFPGLWEFEVKGIFKGRDAITDTRLLFFHWDYLNERNKAEIRRNPDYAGFYLLEIVPGANPADVGKAVDKQFANSFAETLTETETAFVQGFISMSSAIITAMNVVSGVVIVIMLLVLANTMLMSFRERYREYSVLKALGFETRQLAFLIFGESVLICAAGLVLTSLLIAPFLLLPSRMTLGSLAAFFPVLRLPPVMMLAVLVLCCAVALLAGLVPFIELRTLKVNDGLRRFA